MKKKLHDAYLHYLKGEIDRRQMDTGQGKPMFQRTRTKGSTQVPSNQGSSA